MDFINYILLYFSPFIFGMVVSCFAIKKNDSFIEYPYFVIGTLFQIPFFYLFKYNIVKMEQIQLVVSLLCALSISILITRKKIKLNNISSLKYLIFLYIISFSISLYNGAYIEFPSDPLEHIYRIIYRFPKEKYSYFWYNSVLSSISDVSNIKYDLWEALSISMLSVYVFRLAMCLELGLKKSILVVVASWCFWGTNIFSFYRYYVFAGTFYTTLCFLEGLVIIIGFYKKMKINIKLIYVLYILYLCLLNHKQEALFILIALFSLPAWAFVQNILYKTTKRKKLILTVIYICFSALLMFFMHNKFPKFEFNDGILIVNVFNYFDIVFPVNLLNLKNSTVHLTLGIPGYLSLIMMIWVLISKYFNENEKIFAKISLSYFIILFIPPFPNILSYVLVHSYQFYRIIYGSLYWAFLPIGIMKIYEIVINSSGINLFNLIAKKVRIGFILTLVAIIAFGSIKIHNMYGRFDFFNHKVSIHYSPAIYIDALKFLKNYDHDKLLSKERRIITDLTGNKAILMYTPYRICHGRLRIDESKCSGYLNRKVPNIKQLLDQIKLASGRYIMVRKIFPKNKGSWVAELSGHWPSRFALPREQTQSSNIDLLINDKENVSKIYEDEYTYVFQVNNEK